MALCLSDAHSHISPYNGILAMAKEEKRQEEKHKDIDMNLDRERLMATSKMLPLIIRFVAMRRSTAGQSAL